MKHIAQAGPKAPILLPWHVCMRMHTCAHTHCNKKIELNLGSKFLLNIKETPASFATLWQRRETIIWVLQHQACSLPPNSPHKPQSSPSFRTEVISTRCQAVLLWFDATAKCWLRLPNPSSYTSSDLFRSWTHLSEIENHIFSLWLTFGISVHMQI